MYIFFDEAGFLKTVLIYITFTKRINQVPLLNTFAFPFPFLNFFSYQIHRYSNSTYHFAIIYQLHFPLFRALNPLTASMLFSSF